MAEQEKKVKQKETIYKVLRYIKRYWFDLILSVTTICFRSNSSS